MESRVTLDSHLVRTLASERMAKLLALGKAQKASDAVPVVRYYRSMLEVHRMALSYMKNQDLQRALVLLIRFCSFTIEELPKHPQYSEFAGEEKRTVFALLKSAFEHAENIKQELRAKFEEEALEAVKASTYQTEQPEGSGSLDKEISKPASLPSHGLTTECIIDPGISTSDISYSSFNVIPGVESVNAEATTSARAPTVNRSHKPDYHYSSQDAVSPIGVKTVWIAGDLIKKFLTCAEQNTSRNVETCGTLCGRIERDGFVVSHVLLPKQTGASDGCQAEGEEDVFAYQTKHDLITLGWIHTHPSQTAFLSSIDLHTHCAYQMMLNEAVAVVCAPSYNQVGTFLLTPYGMNIVENCYETGFHLHPEAEKLFMEASHVQYSSSHSITVVDMRG